MNKLSKCIGTFSLAVMMTACSTSPATVSDADIDRLYENMTDGERLAQLKGIYLDQFFDENNKLIPEKCKELIPDGAGHFSQYGVTQRKTPDQLRDMVAQMQRWIKENTKNGIPALFHEEVLTGVATQGATVYPQQIGLACSFNTELAAKKTFQTAVTLRKMGGTLALSPMIDVVRNPSFNRLEESYGEDSYLSAAMAVAFVKGLQHDDMREGIAACTKHFLGYGGGGDAPERELMEEILLPHEAAIRTAGSHVVMTGYHLFHGTKCVANPEVMQDILRDYLKFDGVLVSDYGSIEQIDDSLNDTQRAAAAINAGNDVDFPKGISYGRLPEAISQGLVKPETFAAAVKRVLKLKARLGLLDENPKFGAEGHIEFDTPEERETAYQLATQSVVLLENNGVLPLKPGRKIFLTGPNANTMWAMLGDYTYPSMRYFWQQQMEDDLHPRIVNLKSGMADRLPEGSVLTYSRGCDWTEEVETQVEKSGDPRVAYLKDIQNRMIDSGEKADRDEALRMAAESDVIVAAMGENVILCGENRDRRGLRLPGRQEEYVKALIATGKPVVLVLFGGRAQVISGLAEQCAAVVQAWYPGEEGGNAVADILYGRVSPSGKLSVSYPDEEIYEPVCYNRSIKPDSRIAYPFGYGLSYTTFRYDNIVADKTAATDADFFRVSVDVTNTGAMEADEIVQLYVSDKLSEHTLRPIQLQGFKRVTLKPGERQTVSFRISPQQLGYYDAKQWHVVAGQYTVMVGASSSETDLRQRADIELTGKPYTLPLRTHYFAE